jgi:RimJ/RimL family protein N-acetyltransferase
MCYFDEVEDRSRDTGRMPKLIADVVPAGTVANTVQPTLPIDHALVLRPFQDGDVDAVVAAFSTRDIQYFHFRCLDHEEALQWIEDCRQGWRAERASTWAIVQRSDSGVVGRVTMYLSLAEGRAEVSYWVLPEARQRRVATRACRAATSWAHRIGIHRVELQHSTWNEASQHVAVSAGFVREGIRRDAHLHEDGWHDMVLYAHLSSDES